MTQNVLTEQQFSDALDRYFAEKKRRYMVRFRQGAQQYGVLELDSRDWMKERQEEVDDGEIYSVFEIERVRRLAQRMTVGYRVP